MAKNIRRIFAMIMVVAMFVSVLPMQTLAAETVHTTETSPENLTTDVYTTIDDEGNETVVVKITKGEYVDENGNVITVDREETIDMTGKKPLSSGEETKEWTEEDTGDEPGQPEVVVPIVPGEPTQGTGGVVESEPVTNPDGSVTTTTTTDRTVTADTSSVEVSVNKAESGLVGDEASDLNGLPPVYDEADGPRTDSAGKEHLFDRNYLSGQTMDRIEIDGVVFWLNDTDKTITNIYVPEGKELPEDFSYTVGQDVSGWYNGSNLDKKKIPTGSTYTNNVNISKIENWYKDGELIVDIPEGADFMYVGTGEHSKLWVGFVTVVYEKDPVTGKTVVDADGNPVIKNLLSSDGSVIKVNGEVATEIGESDFMSTYGGSRATNFMLMDQNGKRVFGYCCDLETGTSEGEWYSFSNLEDSEYYASEESEQHIRSIVMNGYWGTSDVAKEDGSYETGSLESIKAKLKAAIDAGEIPAQYETYLYSECSCGCYVNGKKQFNCTTGGKLQYDADGNPIKVTYNMLDIIDSLTAGEALCATQAAVWSYSNGHKNAHTGIDGDIIVDASARSNFKSSSNEGEPISNEGNARIEFLYNWLINLETEETSTIVINEKNFVEDLSLTVGDKAEHEKNLDEDQDNDVYNVDLNFKLAFIPSDKDDLLVQITYTDLDGELVSVVRRLAGTNAEGQTYEGIQPEADGSYVLKDLKLSENEDFSFDLRLEGTQYLENGVYVYSPVGGRDASQTFVGIAEGERNVDVSIGMTISFDVDENDHVVAKREWTQTDKPGNDPVPEDPEEEEQDPPVIYRLDPDAEEEIPEEPVPLAAPVVTGSNSYLWILVVMMAVCGIVVINVSGKKNYAA